MKIRKTKKEGLISIKVDFLSQIVYVNYWNFLIILRFNQKKAFGECKSQIFDIGDRTECWTCSKSCGGFET